MDLMERIDTYWSDRADEFSDNRRRDLEGELRSTWTEILRQYLPKGDGLRALDLGTGAGFFAFQLSDLGCSVCGIDYSAPMVAHARQNARELGYDIEFFQMDAQDLAFADETFDFVFTRNVTWTLPDPERAYAEMCRVLKPGGVLLNADCNYGAQFKVEDATGVTEATYQEIEDSPYEHPSKGLTMIRERNAIAAALPISRERRPQFDVDVLLRHGMTHITLDMDAVRLVYPELAPTGPIQDYTNRFFLVSAQKQA